MKNLDRIAVIGDKDVVTVFGALGIDVFPYTAAQKIRATIKELTEKEYSIIMITEKEAENVEDLINRTKTEPYPIILPIPDGMRESGFGMKKVMESIEKAIGKEVKKA